MIEILLVYLLRWVLAKKQGADYRYGLTDYGDMRSPVKQFDVSSRHNFPSQRLGNAVAGIDQLAWPGAGILFKALCHKRNAMDGRADYAAPAPNWGAVGLEHLVSLKRPENRTSCEVLKEFSTLYRAHGAMKG